jgi:hypothetical protein
MSLLGTLGNTLEKFKTAQDGVCRYCNTYDSQLDRHGFCREDDCRVDRLKRALTQSYSLKTGRLTSANVNKMIGLATKQADGTLIWVHE